MDRSNRVTRTTSGSSTGSTTSAGIGIGILTERGSIREDLPPNLTPEGLSVDPNIRIYDSIVYLIYCPEHDKIAVTNVERARCVWFPFVFLNENQTWTQASRNGLDLIIGRKDAEMDAKESARKAPVYDISYLNILRIQLPPEKFITRLAMLVILKKDPNSTFKCCQRSMRINWLRASDILADRIDKIWGPELKNFTLQIIEKKKLRLINEFSLENSFYHYFSKENTAEKKLIKAAHLKPEHIAEIYEKFVEHCYPSFYMSYESFKHYLIKYGFDRNDYRIQFLFRACSLYNHDFLHFYEVLVGLIAMEPNTKHFTEGRLNFIFKYYDTRNNGYLTLNEFIVMVSDIYKDQFKNKTLNETELKKKIEEAILCVGMRDEKISKENFIKAILSNNFKNTENLCRSPKPILPQISGLIQAKTEVKSHRSNEGFLLNRRLKKGSCIRCRDQNYQYCLHCVTFNTIGRCVKPTIISEQWIDSVADDEMNAHKYSIEYVFNNSSVPNFFIDSIKDFFNKFQEEENKLKGLMTLKEDWSEFLRYLTILCEELQGLLMAEDKLIKINSPALVIGDLQGSLSDLMTLEKIHFNSFPVTANNLVFLGNYSGICSHGVEVITYLFSLKLLSPNKVFLLRGTSEIDTKSKMNLKHECYKKYGQDFGKKIFKVIDDILIMLPFAIIIDESIFCCHSGIPKWNKLDNLNQLPREISSVIKEAPIAYELLVNTPLGLQDCLCTASREKNRSMINRSKHSTTSQKKVSAHRKLGVNSVINVTGFQASDHCDYLNSCTFDQTAFQQFMRSNNFQYLIRSHNLLNNEDGFDIRFNHRCISIFSYSSETKSKCTVAFVDGSNQRIRLLSFYFDQDSNNNRDGAAVSLGSVFINNSINQ